MNSNELMKWLKVRGCTFHTHRGSGHVTVKLGERQSQIPMHGSRKVGTGLVNRIKKDLGLREAEGSPQEKVMISYPITLAPDDNDTFLVTCPDLPGMVTFGETEAEAIRFADDALAEHIAARLHDFDDIPRPSGGAPRATLSLHLSLVVTLFWALRDRGWTRADLQRALGWHRVQVDRLFDPNHETKLSRFEAAFRALGLQPEVTASAA